MSMFFLNSENDEGGEVLVPEGEDLPQSQSQLMLNQFWPKVTEEIKNIGVLDLKQQNLPLARIKKIMKLDEDVKMISAEAPMLFAKAAEIFILELTLRAWIHTEDNKRRTLQKNDIAMAITKYDQFDFLIDIVPRDEIKVTTKTSSNDGVGVTKAAMTPDQVQYYFQIAQQNQQALQQTSATSPTTAATQATPIQLVQPQLQTVTLANTTLDAANTSDLSNSSTTANNVTANNVIMSQVVGPNGEVQNIPIQLSAQQLQMIRMQLQGGANQQPIIIQQTTQPTQLIQVSPSSNTGASPIFLTQTSTTNTENE